MTPPKTPPAARVPASPPKSKSRAAKPRPADRSQKTQTTVGSKPENKATPKAEIAGDSRQRQAAEWKASTLSGKREVVAEKAPARATGTAIENRPKATAVASTASSGGGGTLSDDGRPEPGSPASSTNVAGIQRTPKSKDDAEHDAPESTGATPGARATRTADTSLLDEGLDWEYCGLRPVRLGPAVLPPQPNEEDQLFLSADTFDYDQDLDLLWLEGDVRMAQGSRRIGANKVVYDRETADLVGKGSIFVANPGVRLVAEEAQMNLESDTGSISDVHYRLTGKINARGTAERAELVRPELTRYEDIVYSACRPNQNAWTLDAAELELDQDSGRGIARNAKLRIRGVPILYTPYLSFPIDDRRKSGILVPTFGNSDDNGIDVTVPYYWNIAPNMDATISPRYMSKRGLMLGTELRHLSRRQEVELYGEIIPEDSQFNDKARWGVRVEQSGRFARRWSSAVNFNAVSDDEYLEDFGNRLEVTSTRNIERRGDLSYWGDGWSLLTRLQDFQTVDAELPSQSKPYAQLPRVRFSMNPYSLESGIQLGAGAEYNYFQHDAKVHGNRAVLQPYARWPLRRSYGHLIPELNLYFAGYDLQDQEPDKDDKPSYAIPSFNLDAELVFERTVNWFSRESLQTLEPRIFYLYTAFKDQDDQPVFDTSELSLSYFRLFQPNRFSGWDRIGDANQLTVGLTSRTIAMNSGLELLRASVGQTLYFRDREVQIVGPPQDASSSPISGMLSARLLQNWTGRASVEYDPNQETDRSLKRTLELHYQARDNRLLNLTYRFDLGTGEETRYEDTDLSFRLPVNQQIQLVGRWNYSLLNSQTVEAFAGLEYGQCCWRLRLVGRHLQNKPDSAGSTSVMVQVELAGLGSIGQHVDKLFERGIYGYHAD
ncbi:MAG: LPS assembly protein LptD [Chromatiaceae bacterium]|nr:LPS assembly protein LptD [Chromatiaceae bacterium]